MPWACTEWGEESKAGIDFPKHGARIPEAIPAFDDPDALKAAHRRSFVLSLD